MSLVQQRGFWRVREKLKEPSRRRPVNWGRRVGKITERTVQPPLYKHIFFNRNNWRPNEPA